MTQLDTINEPPGRRPRRGVAALSGLLAVAICATAAAPVMAHGGAETTPAMPAVPASGSFADLSAKDLWRYIDASGDRAVVGLKDDDATRGFFDGKVLIDKAERAEAEASVRALRGVRLVAADDVLPTITVEVDGAGAIARLRSSEYVEFVEPAQVDFQVMDGGCTGNAGNTNPNGGELYDPNKSPLDDVNSPYGVDKAPRNFSGSRVQRAWGRSPAGQGVTVGVIDTGVFDTQLQLRSAYHGGHFESGLSSGRTITNLVTIPGQSGNPFDICNHGTRSAGTIAGPRDGRGLVGVAWKASLVTVRVDNDVIIFPGAHDENNMIRGIREAVHNGAKIISIAMGTPFTHDAIRQEIEWQHNTNQVLFVAAAGTVPVYCPGGVVFPARLPQVVAATGTLSTGVRDPESCGGSEVDIAAVSWSAAPGRHESNDTFLSWGGSSSATAIASGTAALIWSKYPTMSRDWVRDRLIWAGQGAAESGLGNGVVDAYKAVGGLYRLSIAGPTTVEANSWFELSAQPHGDGPFTYLWSNGSTSSSIWAQSGGKGTSQTFEVRVTDTGDGSIHPRSITVRVPRRGECTTC